MANWLYRSSYIIPYGSRYLKTWPPKIIPRILPQKVGLRENLNQKPCFFPWNMRLSGWTVPLNQFTNGQTRVGLEHVFFFAFRAGKAKFQHRALKFRTRQLKRHWQKITLLELLQLILYNCFTQSLLVAYSNHCNPCGSWNAVNPSQAACLLGTDTGRTGRYPTKTGSRVIHRLVFIYVEIETIQYSGWDWCHVGFWSHHLIGPYLLEMTYIIYIPYVLLWKIRTLTNPISIELASLAVAVAGPFLCTPRNAAAASGIRFAAVNFYHRKPKIDQEEQLGIFVELRTPAMP